MVGRGGLLLCNTVAAHRGGPASFYHKGLVEKPLGLGVARLSAAQTVSLPLHLQV